MRMMLVIRIFWSQEEKRHDAAGIPSVYGAFVPPKGFVVLPGLFLLAYLFGCPVGTSGKSS